MGRINLFFPSKKMLVRQTLITTYENIKPYKVDKNKGQFPVRKHANRRILSDIPLALLGQLATDRIGS
jgi:hypothetical protein